MSTEISSALSGAGGAARLAVAPAVNAGSAALKPVRVQAEDMPDKVRIDVDPGQNERDLDEAIRRLNDQMRDNGRALNFSVDKVLDRTVVVVKNSETGNVVRQIPDATLLSVAHNLERVKGLLQDDHI